MGSEVSKKEVEAILDEKEVAEVEVERSSGSLKPDVASIMARIRAKVQEDVEANRDKQKPFKQLASDPEAACKAGKLLNSEELRYLNTNYAFGPNLNLESISSHRPGVIGKAIVKVKRKLLSIIWDLLKDYFTSEREFHANLVRYLNDVSKYVDQRDASNFWELIRKIDYDVTKALTRIERINDEQMASIRSSERRMFDSMDASLKEVQGMLGGLRATAAQHEAQLETLESVSKGLESIIAQIGQGFTPDKSSASSAPATGVPDFSYLLLENRFRGGQDAIKEALSFYPDFFEKASRPVLEIGPGRGELLELFKERKIKAYGVDIDQPMTTECCKKGFTVEEGDGIAHLRKLEDNSLGGVIAVQVIEHLTREQLKELFSLCKSKVAKGGRIVFETINPRSLLALSSNYFRDPTHVWPLHPDTVEFAMSLAGLKVIEIRELSPVSEEAQLRELPVEDYMTPRWAYAIESMNRNFRQLNQLIYGYQDYCIVAEVE